MEAGRVLAEAAGSPAKVILFGSYARGEARPDSDLDFLVLEREVESGIKEAGRLRRSLPDLDASVDVLVVAEDDAARRGKIPGTMVHEALARGRVVAGG